MSFSAAFGIWAIVAAVAALEGVHLGFGTLPFAVALGVAALLFAFELFLAAPRVLALAQNSFSGRGAILGPLVPLFAVLSYSLMVTRSWKMLLFGAAYAVVPALLLASSQGRAPGTWEDYTALLVIWIPVALPVSQRLMYREFPYPPPLTHTLAILMALSTAVASFVLLRRLDGIGYAVEWKQGFARDFALHFIVFAAIAIPVGLKIGFLAFHPSLRRGGFFPLSALGVLFFTAWPEEFLFRGVLQNLLSKTFRNRWAGLGTASIIFGLSHVFHSPYPNWKYVFLATIAGLFYGHVWMKTRSLLPGTLVHALVDISWSVFFR
ncbi:MAG TPA: type II CAAX endopeptidase family protein [Candidatus Acidoferrales bacterium]|nr:type II CAAX endopeptidase family protein [Candidatus Acidoferrales bacterium]